MNQSNDLFYKHNSIFYINNVLKIILSLKFIEYLENVILFGLVSVKNPAA
jgi:hypothetical protein